MARAERRAAPKPARARRGTRRAFEPSKPAQAGLEPRLSLPSGAEPGHEQSGGLIASTERRQVLIGIGVVAVAVGLGFGAAAIPSAAGYAGVGPNFLPWLVAIALLLCGGRLIWEAASGGFRALDPPSGAASGDWRSLAWVACAVLANAALITLIGFVFACTLGFMLAVRGLRRSEGRPSGVLRQTLIDAITGLAITAPVYWVFGKVLGISLPGLTGSGWL